MRNEAKSGADPIPGGDSRLRRSSECSSARIGSKIGCSSRAMMKRERLALAWLAAVWAALDMVTCSPEFEIEKSPGFLVQGFLVELLLLRI